MASSVGFVRALSCFENRFSRPDRILESKIPADPFAQAAAHDLLEVLSLQPRQFFGEERDALAIAAWHPRDVRAPEEAVRAEGVVEPMQPVMDVAEGIGFPRIGRRAGRLHAR